MKSAMVLRRTMVFWVGVLLFFVPSLQSQPAPSIDKAQLIITGVLNNFASTFYVGVSHARGLYLGISVRGEGEEDFTKWFNAPPFLVGEQIRLPRIHQLGSKFPLISVLQQPRGEGGYSITVTAASLPKNMREMQLSLWERMVTVDEKPDDPWCQAFDVCFENQIDQTGWIPIRSLNTRWVSDRPSPVVTEGSPNNDEPVDQPPLETAPSDEASLVGHWTFEDESLLDTTGNQPEGALHGATSVTGVCGQPLWFDGDDDYAEIPSGGSVNAWDKITVSLWIKTTQPDEGMLLNKEHNTNSGFFLSLYGGRVRWRVQLSDDPTVIHEVESSQKVNDGRWHHVAATYDGQVASLYLDGEFKQGIRINDSPIPIQANDVSILLGRRSLDLFTGRFYRGFIDEAFIFSRALDSNEIQTLATEPCRLRVDERIFTHRKDEPVWSQTFGGSDYDYGDLIISTSDGGYAIVGTSDDSGIGFFIKLSSTLIRENYIPYNGDESNPVIMDSFGLFENNDRKFIIFSNERPSGSGTARSGIISLINENGFVEWTKAIPVILSGVLRLADNNFAYIGGDKLIVLDGKGETVKEIELPKPGVGATISHYDFAQTQDGGFIMTGSHTGVLEGDDIFLEKLDSEGTMQWRRIVGTSNDEYGQYVIQTVDGGYLVVANQTPTIPWVFKFDAQGMKIWDLTLGNEGRSWIETIFQAEDGSFFFAGSAEEFSLHGNWDCWLGQISAEGTLQWQTALGGGADDQCGDFIVKDDGSILLIGYTASFGAGNSDAWLLEYVP